MTPSTLTLANAYCGGTTVAFIGTNYCVSSAYPEQAGDMPPPVFVNRRPYNCMIDSKCACCGSKDEFRLVVSPCQFFRYSACGACAEKLERNLVNYERSLDMYAGEVCVPRSSGYVEPGWHVIAIIMMGGEPLVAVESPGRVLVKRVPLREFQEHNTGVDV
jgi:hypothetical protein